MVPWDEMPMDKFKEMEAKILGAEEKAQELEYTLFCDVRAEVAVHAARILVTARTVSVG